jgi:hypothetical protein
MPDTGSKPGASASAVFRGRPLAWTIFKLGRGLVAMGDLGAGAGERLMRAALAMARDGQP